MYHKNGGKDNPLPQNGEIKLDDRDFPICHICGRAYKKLLTHVWQMHDMSEKEYKKKFELEVGNGILCQETKDKLQKAITENYDLVVKQNLLDNAKSQEHRFKDGSKGRTRDKVSLQTKNKLYDNLVKNNFYNKSKEKDNG